jgi:predicted tellurium resistance membrane protein TerC
MAAVVSLRAWYSIVATVVSNTPALQTATGAILVYLAAKLVAEFFVPALHISTGVTLLVIASFLGIALLLSLLKHSSGTQINASE